MGAEGRTNRGMDPNLVERAQAGDERAFEAVTVSCHPRLFRVAHGIMRDPELAEDATQRAFLEVWRWLPRLREPDHFDGWTVGHLLRACRSVEAGQADAHDGEASEVPSDDYGLGSHGAFIDRDQLSRGFHRLGFEDRALLVLRFLAEMDAADTGLALGLEPDAVERRVDAAVEALGRWLDGEVTPAGELQPQMEGA